MGLTVSIKGMKDTYDCGYITFNLFRTRLAYAYSPVIGYLYNENTSRELTKEEIDEWNKFCNADLDIFLLHSDCDGKFTPQECRKIYNAIKDMKIDMVVRNYGNMEPYNVLERWKEMFKFCYKHRVCMIFG